jgi:uncharacterized protein (TIGR03437 family)
VRVFNRDSGAPFWLLNRAVFCRFGFLKEKHCLSHSPREVCEVSDAISRGNVSTGVRALDPKRGLSERPASSRQRRAMEPGRYGRRRPGDTIILWGTGFGPTDPAFPQGMVTPTTGGPNKTDPLTVTINNLLATVYGAALASGFAGLYQGAIQVPNSLGAGHWPVVATIGGGSSLSGPVLAVQ